MTWSNAYIGLPFVAHGRTRAGVDCWGLLRLVYAEELGIALPSYTGDYMDTEEAAEIARIVNGAEARGPWRPVTGLRPFDLLLFRRGRHRSHVGIAVDARTMLHVETGTAAHLLPLSHPTWSRRMVGAFRHPEAP